MKILSEENITHVGDKFRIEPGPRVLKAVATPELLDNSQTALHYALEINDTPEGEDPRPGVDALGETIELGKEMTYLDWTGVQQGREGSLVFYAYELDDMTKAEIKARTSEEGVEPEDQTIWRELGFYETHDDALSAVLAKGA